MAVVRSRVEAEKCIQDLARLSVRLAEVTSARDAAVERAQSDSSQTIEDLTQRLLAGKSAVQSWAEKNRKLFGDSQSLEFPRGVIAFHLGPPSLDLLPGENWKGVLKRMLARALVWKSYIRRKPEVDKQKILQAAKNNGEASAALPAEKLRSIGLRVAREESFRIELRTGPNQISVL